MGLLGVMIIPLSLQVYKQLKTYLWGSGRDQNVNFVFGNLGFEKAAWTWGQGGLPVSSPLRPLHGEAAGLLGLLPRKGQVTCHKKVRRPSTGHSRLGMKDEEWTQTGAVVIYSNLIEGINDFFPLWEREREITSVHHVSLSWSIREWNGVSWVSQKVDVWQQDTFFNI